MATNSIDGDRLCELLKQLKLGIEIETVERVAVDADWFAKI
jgi:restriction system protein